MARRLSTQRLTRRRTLAAVAAALVVATGVVTASSASPASSSQADHLRAIETTRLQALVDADTATARKLTAPDFQVINPAGAPLSRDDFLGGVDAGVLDFLAHRAQLADRGAAVRRFRHPALPDGVRRRRSAATHVTHEAWTTALYERRDGRWQIVWEQTTAIPNNLDLFIESIKPVS